MARLADALPLPQLHLPALFEPAIALPQLDRLADALAASLETVEMAT